MIAGDGDGVPLGQILGTIFKNVGNQPHGGCRGEDIGAAGCILLEHVILNGPLKLIGRNALPLCRHNIEGKQYSGGRVDGHAGADLIQRDTVKKHFHIRQRIDGHTDLAHFSHAHGIIRIVADLCGQVKGNGKTRLALGDQVFVTLVAFFRIAKARILTHGPVAAPVHGRLYAPGKGILAGIPQLLVIIVPGYIAGVIGPFHFNTGAGSELCLTLRMLGQRSLGTLYPSLLIF